MSLPKKLRILFVVFLFYFVFPMPSEGNHITANIEIQNEKLTPVFLPLGGFSIVMTFKGEWPLKGANKELVDLSPPVLRFPAGMHSMYYDWETGKYHFVKHKGNRRIAINPVENFFDLAKKYHSQVAYVVNIYRDSPDKTKKLAQFIKSKGFKVKYWELGNEVYALKNKFPNVNTYLKIARMHADAIKTVFPDAIFGVVAENQKLKVNRWNKILAKQTQFNNIIIHRYHGPNWKRRKALQKKGMQVPPLKAIKRMLEDSIPEPMPHKEIFPGKNTWITEWSPLYLAMDVYNSLGHALWMARTFIKYLRTPETTMATYWNLNTIPFGFLNSVRRKVVHRVPFYVYKMVLDQLKWAEYSAPLNFRVNSDKFKLLDGQFFKNSEGKRSVLLVNATGHSYPVKMPLHSLAVEILGSEDARASNGHLQARSLVIRKQTKEIIQPLKYRQEGGLITLPPYAVASITWTVSRRDK